MSVQRPIFSRHAYAPRPGFRVTVHREPNQIETDCQHQHDFYEVAWILAGKGIHVTGGFQHRLNPGDILVLDPCRAHGYKNPEGLNLVNILLDPEWIMEVSRTLETLPGFQRLFVLAGERWEQKAYRGRLRLTGPESEAVTDWVARMEIETHSTRLEAPLLAEAWALQLVALLSRVAEREPHLRKRAPSPQAGVNRLLSWIELHLEKPLRVEDLARESGMSVRTLQRRFKAQTGHGPMYYLLRRRMARAERLLNRHPRLSVAEAAAQCGFDDPNHFSTTVKRHFGTPPRNLRLRSR